MPLPTYITGTLMHQAEHAALGEPAWIFSDGRTVDTHPATALSDTLGGENGGLNDLVIVLDLPNALEFELLEIPR